MEQKPGAMNGLSHCLPVCTEAGNYSHCSYETESELGFMQQYSSDVQMNTFKLYRHMSVLPRSQL